MLAIGRYVQYSHSSLKCSLYLFLTMLYAKGERNNGSLPVFGFIHQPVGSSAS